MVGMIAWGLPWDPYYFLVLSHANISIVFSSLFNLSYFHSRTSSVVQYGDENVGKAAYQCAMNIMNNHDMPQEWLGVSRVWSNLIIPDSLLEITKRNVGGKGKEGRKKGRKGKGMARKEARHGSHSRQSLPPSNHFLNISPDFLFTLLFNH